jgi:ABC-2 type transport system permease protein
MKAFTQLTLAQLKLFARNKTVIFWTTLFPLFLMIMLGLFLGGGGQQTITITYSDEDQSSSSAMLLQTFEGVEAIRLVETGDVPHSIEEIEKGELSFLLVIPEGFHAQLSAREEPKVLVYYDEVQQSVAQIGLALIEQTIDTLNKELIGFEAIVQTEAEGVQSLQLTYLDFLVPGIAALMILSSNMNGVAAQIASWRERAILRRLRSAGLPASTFIAAQITARMTLNLSQSILVLLVGIFLLGAQMNGSWILLLFYLMLGTLVFMSIGFIIAGLAKTPEHAAPVAGFLSFPMFFLGGIFFPINNMPEFLQPVVYLIPVTHLAEVLRHVMNLGETLFDLWVPSAVLGGWFVMSFALAVKVFKWE